MRAEFFRSITKYDEIQRYSAVYLLRFDTTPEKMYDEPMLNEATDSTQGSRIDLPMVGMVLDLGKQELLDADGERVELRPQAFQVLRHLALNAGRVVTKSELHDLVWPDAVVTDDSLVQAVGDLRRVLGDSEHQIIKTVPRRGYEMVADAVSAPLESVTTTTVAIDTPTSTGARANRRSVPKVAILASIAAILLVGAIAAWRAEVSLVSDVTNPISAPAPQSVEPTILVMPFADLSNKGDLGYLTDGMTEDVIVELGRWRQLRISSRNSSNTFKGRAVDARTAALEMGVRYVLEGSVRKTSDGLRVTAQLIDGRNGQHLWADRFDESGDDILSLQDRITEKIVAYLEGGHGAIREHEYVKAWAKVNVELEEYDYFLRGHKQLYLWTKEGIVRAGEIWREGLEKYPDSGLLRIKIGWTHFWAGQIWSDDPKAEYAAAYALAKEGFMDDNLPPAGYRNGVWLRAFMNLYHLRDSEATINAAKKVVKEFHYDTESLAWMARIVTPAGDAELASKWIEETLQRDASPIAPYYDILGRVRFVQQRYDEAIEAFENGAPWPESLWYLAAAHAALDHSEKAHRYAARLKTEHPKVTAEFIRNHTPYRDAAIPDRILSLLAASGWSETP